MAVPGLYQAQFGTVTCAVVVDEDGRVAEGTAPVLKSFLRQPVENLHKWIWRNGGRLQWLKEGC